jgi:DNA-binding IclR family transcriptional regulator
VARPVKENVDTGSSIDTGASIDKGGIQVIARAAAVLRSLRGEADGLSLGEIAARVSLPRSTVQRIVAALLEEQFLTAASMRSGVKLGPGLAQLAAVADAGTEQVARPFLQELSRRADETVDLSVLQNDAVVFVDQVQGTQRLVAVSAIGKRFPLHCTANGKALLAILPPARREELLAGRLKRQTAATITDKASLETALREVRATGLAYDLEEHSVGICAVGTAFLDRAGRAYSISIPVPSSRFKPKRPQLAKLLKRAKSELLTALGVSAVLR